MDSLHSNDNSRQRDTQVQAELNEIEVNINSSCKYYPSILTLGGRFREDQIQGGSRSSPGPHDSPRTETEGETEVNEIEVNTNIFSTNLTR